MPLGFAKTEPRVRPAARSSREQKDEERYKEWQITLHSFSLSVSTLLTPSIAPFAVSRRVGKPSENDADLIKPVGEMKE